MKTIGLVFFVLFSMVSVSYSACDGDINCSGNVDGSDLALFAADFGTTGCGTCDDVIGRIEELEDKIAQLETLLQHVTRSGNDIFIDGANLHIRSGSGYTDGTGNNLNPSVNGLGNLIVGYNELRDSPADPDDRSGSHNIVVGRELNYSSFGGLVVGWENTISGKYASVSGGIYNTASGFYASVSGGSHNDASGIYASVSGGNSNDANGSYASVSGGQYNTASGFYASVSGGIYNTASDNHTSVSGGYSNNASNDYASVSGGGNNGASGSAASVSGGQYNTASGSSASVSGGNSNDASGFSASVSGGRNNTASGECAFVAGGGGNEETDGNEAFGNYSTVIGGTQNIAGDPYLLNHMIGQQSSVSGGRENNTTGTGASVSGGWRNTASGLDASVTAGFQNDAQGGRSSVTGGRDNVASGYDSAVSGGYNRSVSGDLNWRAGSLFEGL